MGLSRGHRIRLFENTHHHNLSGLQYPDSFMVADTGFPFFAHSRLPYRPYMIHAFAFGPAHPPTVLFVPASTSDSPSRVYHRLRLPRIHRRPQRRTCSSVLVAFRTPDSFKLLVTQPLSLIVTLLCQYTENATTRNTNGRQFINASLAKKNHNLI